LSGRPGAQAKAWTSTSRRRSGRIFATVVSRRTFRSAGVCPIRWA